MEENTEYPIRGPLYDNDLCAIGFTLNYVPYYLVRSQTAGYILDPLEDSHVEAVPFRIIGNSQHLALYDNTRGEYLSTEDMSGAKVATPSKKETFFSVKEAGHAHEGVLMAGVNYTLDNLNGEVIHFKRSVHSTCEVGSHPTETIDATLQPSKIRVIPLRAIALGACSQVLSDREILDLDRRDALGQQTQLKLFTRGIDCERGVFYRYCHPHERCGASDCFGPCPSLHSQGTCVFDQKEGKMSCENCFFSDRHVVECLTESHRNIRGVAMEPISIILIVVAVVILIAFMFYLFR